MLRNMVDYILFYNQEIHFEQFNPFNVNKKQSI